MKNINKILTVFILSVLVANIISVTLIESVSTATIENSNSKQVTNFANVVVFIDFKDTDHSKHKNNNVTSTSDECFENNEVATFKYFNGENGYERGLKTYLSNISYGQFEVQNIFPQYDRSTNKIDTYVAQNNREFYENNADTLIQEVVNYLNNNAMINSNQTLDYNNDGCIDNFTMVIADGEEKGGSSYKANYAGVISINGSRLSSYNLLREGSAYGSLKYSGVIIHEFLHTLGYPDLYRSGTDSGVPVGTWDVMAAVQYAVQYPLAYFRATKTNWFTIPTVTESQENYSIYAASKTDYDTRNSQAVILKTEYSDTEFFVLEYRKQEEDMNNSYDHKIPGSGLIIYRINTASTSNIDSPSTPDIAYIFRPGDTYNDNNVENGKGDIYSSFLSQESGRTSYGTNDLTKTLSDGAITYSDGTNSGIVISNVGSSSGDQISFDISFTDLSSYGYWKKVNSNEDEKAVYMDTYIDTDGSMYYLINNDNNTTSLYQYKSSVWTKISNDITTNGLDYKLIKYDNAFYMFYNSNEGNYYAKLLKLNGSNWQEVYKFTTKNSGNYTDAVSDETGIYFAIPNEDNTQLYGYKYSSKDSISNLGQIATSDYLSNTKITVENGNIAVVYREYLKNKINIKVYKNNSWNDIDSVVANSAKIKINDNKIYMLKNGESFEKKDCYMYVYDLNKNNGWQQLGDNTYASDSISEMDICFNGKTPYIVYQGGSSTQLNAMYLKDNKWTRLGEIVANEIVSGVKSSVYSNNIYVTYIAGNSKAVTTKSYKIEETVLPEETYSIEVKYKVEDNKISGFGQKIKKEQFLSNIVVSNNLQVSIDTTTEYVGTNSKVTIKDKEKNTVIKEYYCLVYGDINGDGKISALDYTLIKNHIMDVKKITDTNAKLTADVNGDGKISALDYTLIKNDIMDIQKLKIR